MYLKGTIVLVDPAYILQEEDMDLLYETSDYEKTWLEILNRHNINKNQGSTIYLFENHDLEFHGDNSYDIFPEVIHTDSGYIIGMEFNDLKKLNPDITEENLETAFIIDCHTFSPSMFEDIENKECIYGYITFENENYDPSVENSPKYISLEVNWEADVEPKDDETEE